jgi:hypothetical protein
MIIPLLTVAITTMPEADAEGGEKSCSKKDKSGKTMSSSASKMSYKMSKKSF